MATSTASSTDFAPPSLLAALRQARSQRPRDPRTGEPYRYFGLLAPNDTFSGDATIAYMQHVQEAAVLGLVTTALALPVVLLNVQSAAAGTPFFEAASLGSVQGLSWTHVACDAAATLSVALCTIRWQRLLLRPFDKSALGPLEQAFFWLVRKAFRTAAAGRAHRPRDHESAVQIQRCTVVVWGWDADTGTGPVLSALRDQSGEEPIAAVQPVAARDLLNALEERQALERRRRWLEVVLRHWRGNVRFRLLLAASGGPRTLDEADGRLAEQRRRIAALEAGLAAPGAALPLLFATFGSAEAAQRVLQGRHRNTLPVGGAELPVCAAPAPAAVRWEFLETGVQERRRRQWLKWLVLPLCLLLSTLGINAGAYLQGALHAGPPWSACGADGRAPATVGCVFANLGHFAWTTAVIIISVHVALQPILHFTARAAHWTWTSLNISLFIDCFNWAFLCVVATGVIWLPGLWHVGAFAALKQHREQRDITDWYTMGPGALCTMLLVDALVMNWVVDALNPLFLLRWLCARAAAPSQDVLNESLRFHRPDYLTLRLVLLAKSWATVLLYSSLVPVLWVLHFALFLGALAIDRMNLLGFRMKPLPNMDAVSARYMATVVLPSLLVAKLLLGALVYAGVEARERGIDRLDALLHAPRVLFFLGFGGLVGALLLLELLVQRSAAQSEGLYTPLELALRPFRPQEGFLLEAAAVHELQAPDGAVRLCDTAAPPFYCPPHAPHCGHAHAPSPCSHGYAAEQGVDPEAPLCSSAAQR